MNQPDTITQWENVQQKCMVGHRRCRSLTHPTSEPVMSQTVEILLRINPKSLKNPDLDIRYRLPDLLTERSNGIITDNGYDYHGDVPWLVLFLNTTDAETALRCVTDVIEHERVLNNDLREAVVVAVKEAGNYTVKYPHDFEGPFLPE